MSLPVILRPLAEADIAEIFGDLEHIRAGLGRRFLAQLRDVLGQIESMPEMFGLLWQDVRAVRLKRFRYVVYYAVLPDRVEVLAVLHGSRETSAWQDRVE